MNLSEFGLVVLLSAATALVAPPGASADQKPEQNSKATQRPTDKEQHEQLLCLRGLILSEGGGPVVLRGTLVRTSSEPAFSPRERKVVQNHSWRLGVPVDSAPVLVPPLRGISGNEKLEQVAHQLAGKEVVLTGSLDWVENHLTQWVEGKPYPVIRVESLKLAEQPQRDKKLGEPKQATGPKETLFNVEVRGVLRVSGKLRKIKELESPPNINSPAHAIDNQSIATRALIETRQMGNMEVYFGGDEQLQDRAKKLSGKTVTLVGSLERVTFYSKQDKERFGLLYGGAGARPRNFGGKCRP